MEINGKHTAEDDVVDIMSPPTLVCTTYEPGTEVELVSGVVARVLTVHIESGPNITYTVAWWEGPERYVADLHEQEIKCTHSGDNHMGLRWRGEPCQRPS